MRGRPSLSFGRARMEPLDVLLVGFESQENLGLRYVMASLAQQGFSVELIPFDAADPDAVVSAAKRRSPKMIGFSIIFQYTIYDFRSVMRQLRLNRVDAHLTAGGHFPTLRPHDTFAELPELDSIVRFEGERSVCDLLARLDYPETWGSIPGLAYRTEDEVVLTSPRPLVAELDTLPWPTRSTRRPVARGIPVASILASRGCCFDCSFCSIRQFYGGAPGPVRRCRSAADVVAEMQHLHERYGVRLFVFHDDDFAAKTVRQRQWVENFFTELDNSGLSEQIGWKISCRVDDIDTDIFRRGQQLGLISVYLGVESGSAAGLSSLNKRVTVEQNLRALDILSELKIPHDMGFMLLDPDTSIVSLQENLTFLRKVAEMGGVPISFAKTMPLAGTPIEQRLRREGRLTGTSVRPDYEMADPRIDQLAVFLTLHFSFRNSSPRGLVERLRAAAFDRVLASRFEHGAWIADYGDAISGLIDRSNAVALNTLEHLVERVAQLPAAPQSVPSIWFELTKLMQPEHRAEAAINADLKRTLFRYSPALGAAFDQEDAASIEDACVYY